MGDPYTMDLFDGWRATFEPGDAWLVVRPHPPGNPGQWGLADGIWAEIQKRGARDVVLDMADVTFLPSAVMSEMVRLHKRLAMTGGRLRVCGLAKHPHEAYHLMRLDELMPAYGSLDEARQ